MTEPTARSVALDALLLTAEEGRFMHAVLDGLLQKYAWMSPEDRALLTRLVHGTLEYQIQLDRVIGTYSTVKVRRMKPVVREVLRMSVYQLLYLDRIPARAVCFEAVELTKKRGFAGLSGFVNGVLRHIAGEREQILSSVSGSSDLSFRYSMPEWIVNLLLAGYGREKTVRILESFLTVHPVCIRLNGSRFASADEREKAVRELAQSVHVERSPYRNDILYLSGIDRLADLEIIRSGRAFVQDLSSALSVTAADPQPGNIVFDVCAAPGGKSIEAADLLAGTGHVTAMDLRADKVELIRENIRRSGMKNVEAAVRDAAVFDPALAEQADIVLADLPCSGLGVIGGKPDIRLHATEEGCRELAALQKTILDNVSAYVKHGGRLVYSTCTVNPAENGENRLYFLNRHPEFHPLPLRLLPQDTEGCGTQQEGWLQLLPGVHPCDGFFIAAFEKE